jgi:hypothetical protein
MKRWNLDARPPLDAGTAATRSEVAEYISELSGELARMASDNGFVVEGHLLDIVRRELCRAGGQGAHLEAAIPDVSELPVKASKRRFGPIDSAA